MLRTEWLKLRTVRAPWLVLALAQVVVIAGAAAGALRSDVEPGIASVGFAALFSLLLGVTAVAGEYRHRSITDTYVSEPRRGRVVAGKLAVFTALGALNGAVGCLTALTTSALLSTVDTTGLARTAVGTVVWNALFAAIGVGLGALLRNLVAGVATALAWIAFVEGLVAQLVPAVGRWLPMATGPALEQLPSLQNPLSPWAAGGALLGYATILAVAATASTIRRDVT
jgi:ABC-2 type transport system permease protein